MRIPGDEESAEEIRGEMKLIPTRSWGAWMPCMVRLTICMIRLTIIINLSTRTSEVGVKHQD